MKQKRILYIDYLRIIATIAVIILHVVSQNLGKVPVSYVAWKVLNVTNCAVRWAVPVFVMISGAMFLESEKPLDIKHFYGRKVGRLITAFLFWAFVYALDKFFCGADMEMVAGTFIQGNYHLWFLYMLLGLYILVPLLRKITETKLMTEYFLAVGFVFTFLIPQAVEFLSKVDYPIIQLLVRNFSIVFTLMEFHFTLGYVYYFVLGFYLFKYEIPVLFQWLGYILGMAGFLGTAVLTDWYSVRIGKASTLFLSSFSVNVLMMAVGVFLIAKYLLSGKQAEGRVLKGILNASQYSFGIYLVHVLILEKLDACLDREMLIWHPVVFVLGLTLGTAMISYLISAILNRVQVLKKHIV